MRNELKDTTINVTALQPGAADAPFFETCSAIGRRDLRGRPRIARLRQVRDDVSRRHPPYEWVHIRRTRMAERGPRLDLAHASHAGGRMQHLWTDTGWVSSAAREALVRCLELRRSGSRCGVTEADLRRAFRRLCEEALANEMPPEAVLEAFREAWDHWFSRQHGDDPRDLRYYGTLSQCLDIYLELARPGTSRMGVGERTRDWQ